MGPHPASCQAGQFCCICVINSGLLSLLLLLHCTFLHCIADNEQYQDLVELWWQAYEGRLVQGPAPPPAVPRPLRA